MPKIGKLRETESRWTDVRRYREGACRVTAHGYGLSFGVKKMF